MLLMLTAVTAGFSGGCVPAREKLGPLQEQEAPRSPSPWATVSPRAATANAIVRVTAPEPGARITSPVTVAGEARTFEANVQIRVRDGNDAELAHTFTTALTPDMGVFGPFSASVRYPEPSTSRGFVEVFEFSAKDGSEINVVRIPVVFGAQEWTPVQLFFSPQAVGDDCSETVAVTRRIPKTPAFGRAALEELLEGPTDEERRSFDVTTSVPPGVTVRSLVIRDSVAYADFDRIIEAGGSCRVTAIRASVTQTLLQFPAIRSVVISVEGNVEEALQP
jgi:hypothetical protein